jgi:hypothetical protein
MTTPLARPIGIHRAAQVSGTSIKFAGNIAN